MGGGLRDDTGGLQDGGEVRRGARGRFVAGRSGNPAGRPRGSRNRATVAALSLLDGEAKAITRKAVALAKRGDGVALRLCVERLIPRRDRVVDIELPDLRRVADVVEAVSVVIAAAASGRLTLPEAREFLALLEVQRRALETEDLAVRLELVERELSER